MNMKDWNRKGASWARRVKTGTALALALTMLATPASTQEAVTLGGYIYVPQRTTDAYGSEAIVRVQGLTLAQEGEEAQPSALSGVTLGVYVQNAQGEMRPWANPLAPTQPLRVVTGAQDTAIHLPAGAFYLRVEAVPEGYLMPEDGFYPISSGETVEITCVQPSQIVVEVSDLAGGVYANACVLLTNEQGQTVSAYTDENGVALFAGLTAGHYTVAEESLPEGALPLSEGAVNVTLSPAQRARVSFAHPQKGRLRVMLTAYGVNETGAGFEQAMENVAVRVTDAAGNTVMQTATDDLGVAEMPLSEGIYTLRIDTPEGAYADYTLPVTEAMAQVSNGMTTPVDLRAPQNGGRIVLSFTGADEDRSKAKVTFTDANGQKYGPYRADQDGRIVTPLLAAGAYTLTIDALPDDTRADSVVSTPDGEIALDTGALSVANGESTQAAIALRSVLEQTFTVIGVTPGADGQTEEAPLAGAKIELIGEDGKKAASCTLDDAASATLSLLSGDYTLRVKKADGFEGQTGMLTVGAAAQTVRVTSRLARVEISCVDGEGARLTGAQLRVTDAKGNRYELTADEGGRVRSPLLEPGEAKIETLSAPEGYVPAAEISVTANGGETSQAQVQFQQKGRVEASVAGQELSDAGQIVSRTLAGVTLEVSRVLDNGRCEPTGDAITTDENGLASISLDAGSYALSVRAQTLSDAYDAQDAFVLVDIADGMQTQAQVTVFSRQGGAAVTLSDQTLTDAQLVQTAFSLIDAQGEKTALSYANGRYMALGLPAGTYTLRNESVCAGYSLLADRTVEISGGALTELTLTLEEHAVLSIDRRGVTFDEQMRSYVLPISGLYGVYTLKDGAYVPFELGGEAVQVIANDTGAQGMVSLPAAMEGTTYYLMEIESDLAPGYATDGQITEVTLRAGESTRVQLAATADKGFFRLENCDAGSGEALTGAEFALYSIAEDETRPRRVSTFTLTDTAYQNEMALPVGMYRLVMTRAASGYALDARMAPTQVDFEIVPYLSQGGTVTPVTMYSAAQPVAGGGTALRASLEETDGGLTLHVSDVLVDMAAPVSGVHLTAGVETPEGVFADIREVNIGQVSGDASAHYGARVVYALYDGGWQMADLREVTGLESGAALVDLSGAQGVVTDVAIYYFRTDTGLEALDAHMRAQDVSIGMHISGADASDITAQAQVTLSAQSLDEQGNDAQSVQTEKTAQAQCAYSSAEDAPAVYSAGVDGVIAGVVFEDENGDGLLGAQEARRGGVTVELFAKDAQGNDSVYDQTVTGDDGAYRFSDLPMGVYTLQMDLPGDTMFTRAQAGEEYLSSAITDTAFGRSEPITVDAQHASHLAHAGVMRIARVAGRITILADDGAAQGMSGAYVSLRRAGSETDDAVYAATAEDGAFAFERLSPGAYVLDFDVPEGYAFASLGEVFGQKADLDAASAQAAFTLEMGQAIEGVDIAIERIGSVEGAIFIDADYDGVWADSEQSLSDVQVELMEIREDGRYSVAETVSGADGAYRFDGVRAGRYCLHVTLPEEYVFTRAGSDSQVSGAVGSSGLTQEFTLARGENRQRLDAGATIPAALEVSVWQDTSFDGLRAANEKGLAGVEIALVRLENGEPGDRMTLVTDETGVVSFETVSPGSYRVEYVMPGVWRTTKRGSNGMGSDVSPSTLQTGASDPFTLLMGETDAELSIGAVASVTIAGVAFDDSDGNALLDAGETGAAGVKAELIAIPDQTVLYETTTDEQGAYAFEGVAPGRYRVRFTAAEGCVFSGTEQTSARGNAPYSEDRVSTTATLTLNAGDSLTQINAGVVTPSVIEGTFFVDADDDGVQSPGETGLAGVTVALSTQTGRSTGVQMQTDETGAFRMDGIRPGTYTLRVSLPEDYVFSSTLSDSIVFTEHTARSSLTQAFVLSGGEGLTELSFGTLTQGVIAGTVFNDANFDGQISEKEGTVRGVVVELLRADADPRVTTTGAGGTFRFTELMPGDYTLRVTLPDGMVYTCEGVSMMARSDERTQESGTISLSMGESCDGLYIGALAPASISGRAWLDADNDGRRASEEAAMEGIEVTLYRSTGADYEAVETVTTGKDGLYAFTGVMSGTYALGASLEAGYAFARRASGTSRVSCMPMTDAQSAMSESRTFSAGDTADGMDIGVVQVGTLTGTVYLDADYDGEKDKKEGGVENAAVELLSQDGTLVVGVVTAQDGSYRIEGVRAGTYKLRFALPSDKVFTCAGEGALIAQSDEVMAESAVFTFAMGENKSGCDVGAIDTARISGRIFADNDFSGTFTQGEGGVSRAAVELLGEGSVLATTRTDVSGAFTFDRLRPGTYSVRIALPGESLFTDDAELNLADGVTASADAESQFGTIVADLRAAQGTTDDIKVEMGDSFQLAYPAIYTSSVSGFAFEDQNVNGLYDDDENALPGTKVELLRRENDALKTIAQATVGEDGTYRFTYLWPGQYAVRFTLPDGYLFTQRLTGADPARNSDAYEEQGQCAQTDEFTLQTGQKAEHADVGAILPARLGDTVFVDENANGWLDFGEAQPQGVAITLYSVAADGTRTLVTELASDEYGFYRFDSLRPGSYMLCVTPPEGYTFAPANVGGFAEIDSDIVTTLENGQGETAVITLSSGEVKLNCDIGLIPLA